MCRHCRRPLFQFHKGTIRTNLFTDWLCCGGNFNSIKVRLERASASILIVIAKFQFHKGTIRTTASVDGSTGRDLFQFHKGTIRTFFWYLYCRWGLYFNSIKVRLEQHSVRQTHGKILYFNSIKVRLEHCLPKSYKSNNLFQFHKGTIRTFPFWRIFSHQWNFNSIKVRLERRVRADGEGRKPFQFHKGTIRTLDESPDSTILRIFQFHKGTIRTYQNLDLLSASRISIP